MCNNNFYERIYLVGLFKRAFSFRYLGGASGHAHKVIHQQFTAMSFLIPGTYIMVKSHEMDSLWGPVSGGHIITLFEKYLKDR